MIVTVALGGENIMYTDQGNANFCYYYDGILNQCYTLITCTNAIMGQFVQLQLNVPHQIISLYKVEVHGK